MVCFINKALQGFKLVCFLLQTQIPSLVVAIGFKVLVEASTLVVWLLISVVHAKNNKTPNQILQALVNVITTIHTWIYKLTPGNLIWFNVINMCYNFICIIRKIG